MWDERKVFRVLVITPLCIVMVSLDGDKVMDVRRERSIIQLGGGEVDQGLLPPDFGVMGMWDSVAVLTWFAVRVGV